MPTPFKREQTGRKKLKTHHERKKKERLRAAKPQERWEGEAMRKWSATDAVGKLLAQNGGSFF